MTIEQYQSDVRTILSSDGTRFASVFNSNEPIADCIEVSKVPLGSQLKNPNMFDPDNHIQTRLGHVSVNPNDPGNTKVLTDSYVYLHTADGSLPDRSALNYDENRAEEFVKRLMQRAKEFRELSVNEEIPDPTGRVLSTARNMLLVGERGSGKTFFINHLFSRFHGLFNEQKIVWVRVNLVPDRGFDSNIHQWIHAQTAKILLRYYDEESQRNRRMPTVIKFPFYRTIQEWITEEFRNSPSQRDRYIDALEEMRQAFCVTGNDQEISTMLCNAIICTELFRRARLNGYSFIIVLDGLDRLESDSYYQKRFAAISNSVRSLWNSYEAIGGVFLYVTRGETFAAHRNVAPYNQFDEDAIFHIEAVGIRSIVDYRIKAVLAEIPAFQARDPALWGRRDWAGIVLRFQQRLFAGTTADGLSVLDESLTRNNRAKVQIVQQKFQEFLQSETHQGYKLIEHMMLAGRRYPPLYYRYHLIDGKVEVEIPDQTHIDNRYIPIVTRPPLTAAPEFRRQVEGWYSCGSPLLGLRLIQLVSLHEAWLVTQKERKEPIAVHELADILQYGFGYDRKQVVAYIWELENYEILRPRYNGHGNERSENVYLVTYPKAKFILDVCIKDVAFLNLCGMRTPITRNEHKSPALFREAFLDPVNGKTIDRWILAKIINSLSVVAMLRFANSEQRSVFGSRIKSARLSHDSIVFVRSITPDPVFSFLDGVIPDVESELVRIYRSVKERRDGSTLDAARVRSQVRGIAERLGIALA